MANMQEELTTDFSGGMDDSSADTAFPKNAVQMLLNGRIRPDGTIEVRGGSQRAHDAALNSGAQAFGATEFRTTAGVVQWVVFVGDAMFFSTDEGASWTNPSGATGLREDYWSISSMRAGGTDYLLCVNGGTDAFKWDGETWGAIASCPSGAKYGAVFNGRFYVTGHDGPLVQGSAIDDPESWAVPAGVAIAVTTHDGESPTGLFQLGPHLLVFKRSSTSYVDGFGNSDIIVASGATGFSRSVGCVAFRSIVAVSDDGVCWLSERGIEYYSPATGIRLMSPRLRTFFRGVAWDAIAATPGMPSAAYRPSTHEYHLALPTTGTQNNRTVVVNMAMGAISVDRPSDPEGDVTLYVGEDGSLSSGSGYYEVRSVGGYLTLATEADAGDPLTVDADGYLAGVTVGSFPAALFTADRGEETATLNAVGYDGFVRYMEFGTTDDADSAGSNGTAIGFVLVSRPYLFGRPDRLKWGRTVYVSAISDEGAAVTVSLRANGRSGALHTLSIPATAFSQGKREKARVSGRGDSLQVELRTADAARFSLVGVGGEVLQEAP